MHHLDLKGLNCPLPLLKTKKFLATMAPNECVTVLTTDGASANDLQDFCQKTGYILLNQQSSNGIITSIIKKSLLLRGVIPA